MQPDFNDATSSVNGPSQKVQGSNVFMQGQQQNSQGSASDIPVLPSIPQAPGAVDTSRPAQVVPQVPINSMNNIQDSSLIADDADLIEKEWVMKAKAIVMHTKDDPHKQVEEIVKVKADYLKKRYNKDIKTND